MDAYSLSSQTSHLKVPNVIGIGPTRCGTTWLHEVLRQDKRFTTSIQRPKETHFFTAEVASLGIAGASRQHYPDAGDLIYDISPDYCALSSREIACIARMSPGAKVIAFRRDPIERAISVAMRPRRYSYLNNQGATETGSLAEYLQMDSGFARIERRYAANIKRWSGHFDVMTIDFDDIRARPGDVLARLTVFLDLENPIAHANTPPQNVSSDIAATVSQRSIDLMRHGYRASPVAFRLVADIATASYVARRTLSGILRSWRLSAELDRHRQAAC